MQGNNEKKQSNYFSLDSLKELDRTFNIVIGGRGNGKSIRQLDAIKKLCKNKDFKLCQFSSRMVRLILDDEFPNYDIKCKKKYIDKNTLLFNVYFMSDNFFNYYTLAGNMLINDVIATLKEIIPNGKEEK